MKPILALILLISPVLADVEADAANPLADATTHLREGKFALARDAAMGVSESQPEYARAQYLVGEISLLLGEQKKAISAYRRSLKAKPNSGPILAGLGRALVATEDYEEAMTVLREAVAKSPKSGRAHCFLGIATRNETFGKRGAKQIEHGVKLAPNDPVVVRGAALYWLDEEQPKRALKVADTFRKKHPKHPMGYFLQALAHERAEQYDKAITAYQKSIECDKHFIDAHKNLAILCIAQNPMYKDKKRTDLAMKHFDEYRKLGGKDAGVLQIHETLKQFMPQITGQK